MKMTRPRTTGIGCESFLSQVIVIEYLFQMDPDVVVSFELPAGKSEPA